MQAITRLYRSGLSRAEVADGVGVSTQMIGMYERFKRFPSQVKFLCIVELAESRGLNLLARDFVPPASEVACEDIIGKPSRGKRKKV